MKNKEVLIYAAFSIAFTIWYCRFVFTPSSEMLGGLYYIDNFAKTDNYQTLTGIVTNMQIIQSGHVPFGAFWLFNYYGGSIATFFHVAFMPNIGDTSLLGITLITNDPILAFKILVCAFLFVSQFCAYKFAKFFFQKTSIAWIFSLSYSFSTFYFTHINNGVIEFIAAAALLPGVLLLFEKMFVSPNRKNMVFATFSLIILFFCDLQITIFSIFYIVLRIVYFVATYQNKEKNNHPFEENCGRRQHYSHFPSHHL